MAPAFAFLAAALFVARVSASPSPMPEPARRTVNADKVVVAHHIVGFTFGYTQADWTTDITLAAAMGIDAFALNFGSDSWQPAQLASAYAAAEAFGTDFKLFLSADMTSLPCASATDAAAITSLLNQFATHPNQFQFNGRPLLSTFAGSDCTFGADNVDDGWASAVRTGVSTPYWFVPSFFVDPATFSSFTVTDGEFNWNGGWPMTSANETFDGDAGQSADVGAGKIYMAAATPWFFTHYGPPANTFSKNSIFQSNDWLWNTRWEELVQNRDQVDIVEVVTWNDYSESHYVGNINTAAQVPPATTWLDGFEHDGWAQMLPYYIAAFKTGTNPAITADRVFIWSKPQPAAATATADPLPAPSNADFDQDVLWAVVFATDAGELELTSGTNSATSPVVSGVNKFSLPSAPGGISGTLTRGGAEVVKVSPTTFTYTAEPSVYNFNAFVAWGPM